MEHIVQYIHFSQFRVPVPPHTHIVIIFWYTYLYLNYPYGVGKCLVVVESLN